MTSVPTDYDSARAALTRLIPLAMGDTGQARRVANFLMAWWNDPELGQFEIADMFGLDPAKNASTIDVSKLPPEPELSPEEDDDAGGGQAPEESTG